MRRCSLLKLAAGSVLTGRTRQRGEAKYGKVLYEFQNLKSLQDGGMFGADTLKAFLTT